MVTTMTRTAGRLAATMLMGLALPVAACDLREQDLDRLDSEQLLEYYQDYRCMARRDQIATRLHDRLADHEPPKVRDARALEHLHYLLAFDMLRIALRGGERALIEQRLRELDDYAANLQEKSMAGDGEVSYAHAGMLDEIGKRSEAIRAVLDGRTPPSPQRRFEPALDWTLYFGFCGTPAMSYYTAAVSYPGIEDAWAAVARDDLAIQHLIETQWLEALGHGMLPPRLREFGMRMLGEKAYAHEVEAALAGIRVDTLPTGRAAFLPFLGHWLPLPIALKYWNEETSTPLDTPSALADWLRPKLLKAAE